MARPSSEYPPSSLTTAYYKRKFQPKPKVATA